MDNKKKLEIAHAKQKKETNPIEKAISDTVADTISTSISPQLEKFVADLNRVLADGIHIKESESVGNLHDKIEKFGLEADGIIDRVASLLRNIDELNIPDTIQLSYDKSISDAIANLDLVLPVELTQKIAGLDARIEALAKVLSEPKLPPSKRVEDYQPVRIVVGDESNLHYLLNMPSSFGGGGGISDSQIARLQGFPVPSDYDEIELGYMGDDLTSVVYKKNSLTLGTLTLSYSDGKLSGVVFS